METMPTRPERTETGELTETALTGVTAGIDHMSKEELESLKETLSSLGTDELTIDELGNVMAGTPMDYETAKAEFEEHVPTR